MLSGAEADVVGRARVWKAAVMPRSVNLVDHPTIGNRDAGSLRLSRRVRVGDGRDPTVSPVRRISHARSCQTLLLLPFTRL